MTAQLTIGFLGGVPPVMGGGGLEAQMRRTREELTALGHRVVHVSCAPADTALDVVHGFHAEATLLQWLPWWQRNRCPLVLSPVLSVRPGLEAAIVRATARVPFAGLSSRARRLVLGEAAHVVVITDWERRLVTRSLGVDPTRVSKVSNGVDLVPDAALPALPPGLEAGRYVLMLGAVTARKQQAEVIEALGGGRPVVVAGAAPTEPAAERRWTELVARRPEVTWLGHVADRALVQRLQRDAAALILLSAGEVQSLSVLEALAVGTPAIVSDIPVHRELHAAHPALVRLCGRPGDVAGAVASLPPGGLPPAAVPTWSDVARELELVYRRALRDRAS